MKPVPPFLAIRQGVSFWVEDWANEQSWATLQAVREACYRNVVFYDAAGIVWPVLEATPARQPGLLDRLLLWRRVPITVRLGDGTPQAVTAIRPQLRAIVEGHTGFDWQHGPTPPELVARFEAAEGPAAIIEIARQLE